MVRLALRPNQTRQRVSRGVTIPAPVKGWNAIDPLANMKPEYAVQLDNWIPRQGYCELRNGFVEQSDTGTTDPVDSVMGYQGVSTEKLFCAAGDTIYDATTFQDTASASVTGLANARWQHVNFATSGGNFLWCCNGEDTPQYFDGASWAAVSITGITAEDIIGVAVFKGRLWLVRVNTINAAYLGTDSIQGTASAFSLTGVFSKGGYLAAIGTWSLDGGAGQDDLIVFISSRGQAAVYSGTNPASDFALIGVYDISPPIGRRCITKLGGDLAVATIDGVVPLGKSLSTDRAASTNISLTRNIQPVMAQAARNYSTHYGWELISYPRGTLGILNIPVSEGIQQHQYVVNTLSGAWCRFTGWDANCFVVFNDKLYFGGNDGKVYLADTSGDDNGTAITADLKTAWNYFNKRGQKKQFRLYRPVMTTDDQIVPSMALNTDFRDDAALVSVGNTVLSASRFDAAVFDTDMFAAENRVQANWVTAAGLGFCASIHMRAQVTIDSESVIPPETTLQVNAFDIIFEDGGLI